MAAQPVGEEIKWLREHWRRLAEGALWLFGVLSTFILAPPVGLPETDEKMWLRLAQFMAAIVLGLVLVIPIGKPRAKTVRNWALVAGAALLGALALFFAYQHLSRAWSCPYAGHHVVIGTEYTVQGERYARNNPGLSCEALLEDFAGKADDVWLRESINRRQTGLTLMYVGAVPLFAVCVIALLRALHVRDRASIGGRASRQRSD